MNTFVKGSVNMQIPVTYFEHQGLWPNFLLRILFKVLNFSTKEITFL